MLLRRLALPYANMPHHTVCQHMPVCALPLNMLSISCFASLTPLLSTLLISCFASLTLPMCLSLPYLSTRPQDYLETKRIAFPRFYFVAPADLLDILSKGSNPQLILRHLPKNFDNVHNLSFKKVSNQGGCPAASSVV